MSAFACGRCAECDGGRGSAFCLRPSGTTPTFRCDCGRVLVDTGTADSAQIEASALRRAAAHLREKYAYVFNSNVWEGFAAELEKMAREAEGRGRLHSRPDGKQCAYLAEDVCNKCGAVGLGDPWKAAGLTPCATCGRLPSDVDFGVCNDCRGRR